MTGIDVDTDTDENAPTMYVGEDFGTVSGGTVVVEPDGRHLDPGLDNPDLPSHSPDGFQCGYRGSGPAQLAAALLYDVTGDAETVQEHYQQFKTEVVATLGDEWALSEPEIRAWLSIQTEVLDSIECNHCGGEYDPRHETADDHDTDCPVFHALRRRANQSEE